jgi:hypothetical protein
MKKLRDGVRLVVSVLALSSLFLAPAAQANVAPTRTLAKGYVYLYEHGGLTGARYDLGGWDEESNFVLHPCTGCVSTKNSDSDGTWSDQISSINNMSDKAYCFYGKSQYRGLLGMVAAREEKASISRKWNDDITSARACQQDELDKLMEERK